MHVPKYRYLLCDLLTDRPVAVLPLSGVSFGRRISRVGSLQATLNCSTARTLEVGRTLKAYAGRAALWVYRDDSLWWGGIPWTVHARQGTRGSVQVSVTASTFDSYAHRRRLHGNVIFSGIDQGYIIPMLWQSLQADVNGTPAGSANIGVEAPYDAFGFTRDRIYAETDFHYYGKLIEDLGDLIDGPEHTIDVFEDEAGNRVKRLRQGMPLGDGEHGVPRIMFQPSNLLEWEETADAVDGGTLFKTRGNATGSEGDVGSAAPVPMSDDVYAADLLTAGWPVLDVSAEYSDVSEVGTLNEHAEALKAGQSGAEQLQGYTVRVGNTGWNPNRLGERVRIKLSDPWHGDQDRTVRPVGVDVTPNSRSGGETVKLILGGDE